MTTANIKITKILFGRGNSAISANYTGVMGEVTMDTTFKTLRVHDGVAVGGTRLATYQEVQDVATGNLDLSGYATTAQVNAANAAIIGLQSNASTQATEINSLRANVTASNLTIQTLQSNAVTQSIAINSINANLGAFQTYANVTFGVGTYSNVNVEAYIGGNLGAFQTYANSTFGSNANMLTNGAYQLKLQANGNVTTNSDSYFLSPSNSTIGMKTNGASGTVRIGWVDNATGDQATVKYDTDGIEFHTTDSGVQRYWRFRVNGTTEFPLFAFPAGGGSSGQRLTTNGAGQLYWDTPANLQAESGNITANQDAVYSLGEPNRRWKSLYAANIVVGSAGHQFLPNSVAELSGNVNSYSQINFRNQRAGTAATTDYVLTADNGTDTEYYLDVGLASSGYDNTNPSNSLGNVITNNDGYIYIQGNASSTTGGNLALGVTTPGKHVTIFAGGVNDTEEVAKFSALGIQVTGNILPKANVTYSLGNEQFQWKDLWVSNNTIYIGNTPISVYNGNLLVNGSPVTGRSISSLTADIDTLATVNTSETEVTNNIYNNTTDFVTDIDPGLGYPISAWSQRNSEQIEIDLFVPVGGSLYTFLLALSLGRVVTVTYSTAGGNQTFTSVLSQVFSGIAQVDPVTGWGRVAGRIDGTLPANQTGIVSVNFPVTSTNSYAWYFGSNGILTAPSNITAYGNITGDNFAANTVTAADSADLGSLNIYAATISMNDDQWDNITIAPNVEGWAYLQLPKDSVANVQNVRIHNDAGNIELGTGSGLYNWYFNNSGNLIIPGNINYANGTSILTGLGGAVNGNIVVGDSEIQFIANSSGDGYGLSTIRLVPYTTGYDTAHIIIDPTYPNHIHVRAGGEQDNSTANLFLGGEASHFNIEEGANPNVSIRANHNTWRFGTDGILTLPGALIFNASPAGLRSSNYDIQLVANNSGTSKTWEFGSSGALTFPSGSLIDTENQTLLVSSMDEDSIVLQTHTGGYSGGGTDHYWTFDNNGKLTLAGNVASLEYTGGNFFIDVNANENIVIGNSGGLSYWAFNANTQTITFPDATIQPTAFFGYSVPTTFNNNVSVNGNLTAGNLTFPDLTSQSTAWTGSVSQLVDADRSAVLNTDGVLSLVHTVGGNPSITGNIGGWGDGITWANPAGNPGGGTFLVSSTLRASNNVDGGFVIINNDDGVNRQWKFGTDGKLTVPGLIQHTTTTSQVILTENTFRFESNAGTGSTYIEGQQEALFLLAGTQGTVIGANGHTWQFTSNAELIAPGNIITSNNVSVGNLITTNGVFWSNGVAYSTGGGGTYGNTEVAAYLLTGVNSSLGTLVATNFSTANARITGGSITGVTGTFTTLQASNFSSSNVFITGAGGVGYAQNNAVSRIGNVYSTYANFTNFSTANSIITGGSLTGVTGAATTWNATNFSSGNIAITGGYLEGLANVTATGNVTAGNLIGYGANTTITAGTYTSVFDTEGMVTVPNITVSGTVDAATVTTDNFTLNESGWSDFTPTVYAGTSAISMGDGLAEGRYRVIGKTVHVWMQVTMGSTTTFGSGEYKISLPVTSRMIGSAQLGLVMRDEGTRFYNSLAHNSYSGSGSLTAANVTLFWDTGVVTNASPFTWASGDFFIISGTYEAS